MCFVCPYPFSIEVLPFSFSLANICFVLFSQRFMRVYHTVYLRERVYIRFKFLESVSIMHRHYALNTKVYNILMFGSRTFRFKCIYVCVRVLVCLCVCVSLMHFVGNAAAMAVPQNGAKKYENCNDYYDATRLTLTLMNIKEA